MKLVVIYDDTGRKSEVITDIIGEKGFADVVVKKKCLEDYFKEIIEGHFGNLFWKKIRSGYEYAELPNDIEILTSQDVKIIHVFSNYIIYDKEKALLSIDKINFIDEPYAVMDGKMVVAAMFPDLHTYTAFCRSVASGQKPWDKAKEINEHFNIDGMVDIGIISNFIQCITGNFDSRFFNSLKGDEYTIVKSSTNKRKIKAEYEFYHLLPEDMKYWFVLPFDYKEDQEKASYTMERLHMTDLAIKWVHGSMDISEFELLMDKYFYFFNSRHKKLCSQDQYQIMADALYVKKVNERIEQLKSLKEYKAIESLLEVSENTSIDHLVEKYYLLKKRIEAGNNYETILVIGHGDPCFANTLYNKSTQTLKFIDPKGATCEEDLWTNPYYDVAKLSHSVCGRYDFFNNGLYDIHIAEDFSYNLEIPFDNSDYKDVFKKKVEENWFDYLSVRIYEASLFLSMLPLHIDNPHKVLGFILNVKNILEEIEKDV